MGARVYIPGLGRFLSVDPQQGGTPNNYTYPVDPVNDFDLDGNWGWKSLANIASFVSMIPGPIGMVASGVAAVSYAAAGDYKSAAIATAGIALAAVGAGAAVVAAKAARSAATAINVAKTVRTTATVASSTKRLAGGYRLSTHAAEQMIRRSVVRSQVENTIQNGVKFKYIHEGIRKTGFYDTSTKIFVATRGKKILTVVNNVKRNYINNLFKG